MKKCVITVVGKDRVGIIAKTCMYLAEANINILDISQTIVDGYFNMMAIVDVTNTDDRSVDPLSERRDLRENAQTVDADMIRKAGGLSAGTVGYD